MIVSARSFVWIMVSACCLAVTGCGNGPADLPGRWFNHSVSVRFRENGSVLYNSNRTGLVEGRYKYTGEQPPLASHEPFENLTVWLPQPQGTETLKFEMRFISGERLQLRQLTSGRSQSSDGRTLTSSVAILKRAPKGFENANTLDESQPLAGSTPN